ncbi:MAG TPA: IclR family transcriptional regulator [Bryobacteraceae bacterium]|jgi:DNA-binding IclR family transcriptional regulator|nr:IclR family transcriptional regulator [Bryobacteraceae bacterium]
MKSTTAEVSGIRVLHKTVDILETIKQSRDGLRLADLVRSVELPKATVYRILYTLETRGYLDRDSDGNYRLAKKLFDLQRSAPVEQVLTEVAPPFLSQVAAESKETVNLGILDAGEIVVISTIESSQAVRMSSKVGNRRHLHATALGKVMLAGLPDKQVLRLIKAKGLPRLTEHTLTTKPALLAELQKIRQQGYAIDNQENEVEGRCVAAPIAIGTGQVIAALSISGPVFRMDLQRARSLVQSLKEACASISHAISS